MTLHTCPVLVFTPEVEHALQWFEATHRVELVAGQMPQWQQTALPYTGGLNEQPAKLLDALTFVREQKNAHLMRQMARRQKRANG